MDTLSTRGVKPKRDSCVSEPAVHSCERDPAIFPVKVGSNYPGYEGCIVYVNCLPPVPPKVPYKPRFGVSKSNG